MRIAFYAPLKPVDHPVPSGDRLMGRLIVQALRRAGHEVEIATDFRSFARTPDGSVLTAAAAEETARLAKHYHGREAADRPQVWFTYHPYYKAPDLIGPGIARQFGMAYVTAEASFAGKRDRDEWAGLQAFVKDAVAGAQMNFCMTPIDRQGVEQIAGADRICLLPPFIDISKLKAGPHREPGGPVRLVTVAMMRPGVKFYSYRLLAAMLAPLTDLDWSLTVAGDGSERAAVEALFDGLPASRIEFTGELDAAGIANLLARGDIFVWPGIGEAYGLAYLEAQGSGLPVVAVDNQGVPSVVIDGRTGLLARPGDVADLAGKLARLIEDDDLRHRLGAAAREFVRSERTVDAAAAILDQGLKRALALKA